MIFASITLLAALGLAAVADWFSIIGFIAIYAAAPMHALIMGIVLALAKLVTTSWVYRNWKFASWRLKGPLIGFVLALMVTTSIGTFGFLSKAHLEQGASTIDNSAKIERLDQQIAREKSVIVDDEKVIAQLDATINSYIGKDRTDRSLAVRKSQAPQRKQLRDDIEAAQKRIDTYSDEKLKLQSEVRKQQLDVGPIRYIAELFYGVAEDSTKNIEAAVRIFTLLIVSTLDPLAVILLIAANHTFMRHQDEKKKNKEEADENNSTENKEEVNEEIIEEGEIGVDSGSDDKSVDPEEHHEIHREILSGDKTSSLMDKMKGFFNTESPVSLHSIKQPGPSRVENFSIEERENVPTEPLPTNKSVNSPIDVWANQNPVLRELFGNSPHFIPQKINEEEKSKIQKKGDMEKTEVRADIETIQQGRQGTLGIEDGNITTSQPLGTKESKYPRALSWLTEFRRF